jgi:hypothetical protein
MLVAYFDESGIHSGGPVTLVCGLVNTLIRWSRIERPWKDNLAVTGVPYFHAADCENGWGEFENIRRPFREALVTGLSNAVCDSGPELIAMCVIRDAWDRDASPEIRDRFKDPYYFCFEGVLQKISTWSDARAGGEPVAVVMAEQSEYQDHAAQVYRLYSNLQTEGLNRLGSFSLSSAHELVQLQAADLVSYETYRYQVARLGAGAQSVRPAFQIFAARLSLHGSLHDSETIKELRPIGRFSEES